LVEIGQLGGGEQVVLDELEPSFAKRPLGGAQERLAEVVKAGEAGRHVARLTIRPR
jgi:hypothetical protein